MTQCSAFSAFAQPGSGRGAPTSPGTRSLPGQTSALFSPVHVPWEPCAAPMSPATSRLGQLQSYSPWHRPSRRGTLAQPRIPRCLRCPVPLAQLQLAPARGTTEVLTIDAISAALLP